MASGYLKTVLTPSAREAEVHYYGRTYPSFDEADEFDLLKEEEIQFAESRDSFYLATVTENGWPYLQHRGGPRGFLKSLGGNRIAFADYGGNRQMVSVGSVNANPRVSLFLMDYPTRTRLKLLGNSTVLDASEHQEVVRELEPESGHAAKVERIFQIEVQSFDWNCPKFITPRYSVEEIDQQLEPLHQRIAELENELKTLRS